MVVKFFGLFFFVLHVAAAPATSPAPGVIPLEKQEATVIPIVSQSEEVESNGTFKFSYETGNGIKREETAYVKVVHKPEGRSAGSGEDKEDTTEEIQVQRGSYSYTAPDGTVISIKYVADENGFQPIGSHIPTAASPVADGGSDKSDRALSSDDSAGAASAPVLQARSAAPSSVAAPSSSDAPSAAAATSVTTTSAVESSDASTTEATKENSTTSAPSELSTTTATSNEDATSTTISIPSESSTSSEVASASESSTTVAAQQPESQTSSSSAAAEASTTEVPSTPSV